MTSAQEIIRGSDYVTEDLKREEPGSVRITLSVCGCYKNDTLTLITEKASRVASILGITTLQLECFAITAMFTGKPEVVGCYRQHDVAEAKLVQLEMMTPFIARACHSFELQSDE
jgi:hypothetical protein